MRKRLSLLGALAFVSILIPSAFAYAAGFVPCAGPVGGTYCNLCEGVVLIQYVINGAIIIAFLVALIMFTWAGGLMMTSAANPTGVTKAKSIFKDAAIGFGLVLFGFLIIDTIIHTVIINSNSNYFGSSSWSSISCNTGTSLLNKTVSQWLGIGGFSAGTPGVAAGSCSSGTFSNGACQQPDGSYKPASGYSCPPDAEFNSGTGQCNTEGGNAVYPESSITAGGAGIAQCSDDNTACSAAALQQTGMSANQANVMSCIAVTESSGNPSIPPGTARTASGQPTTACGTFQILQGTWNGVSSKLSPSCGSFSSCTNAVCNAQAAAVLVQQSGYSSWTCPGCNSKAQACINRYSSGTVSANL